MGERKFRQDMTDWDAGNILCYLADEAAEKEQELKATHPKLAHLVHRYRMRLGDEFNRLDQHGFDLPGTDDCDCKACLKARKERK